MRLLLAVLFVLGGICLVVSLLIGVMERNPPILNGFAILIGIGLGISFYVLCITATFVFNLRLKKEIDSAPEPTDWKDDEASISSDFKALRAFQVEEFEDEGSHYFVELEDTGVLYLSGDFLYDYEPIEDDPELTQPRRFPCTDFTIRSYRYREEEWVSEIICQGEVIKPESVIPAFPGEYYRQRNKDKQVELITDKTYDQIKESLSAKP